MADDDWAPAAASPLAEVTGTGPWPEAGVEVPGFADLREFARGGDAIVYRARQLSIDREVAVKVVQINDPDAAARFERELAITVRLGRQHPHIVTVLDTTTTSSGEPCLIMDFYELGSLHERLREVGPLPVSDVVSAGTAVADALAFAHSHGVLHRDVKPQNVLVLPTSYVLSDFGIARMADAGHTATLERFSYRHASPQVLDGMPPTAADDVWSLGSTLFTLLDGRAPFASLDPHEDTALSYLRRVRTGRRRTLQRDDVPAELVAFLDDCLILDRDERLGSAADALRRLRRIRTEDRSWNPAPVASETDVATRPRGREVPDGAASRRVGDAPEETSSEQTSGGGWAPGASARQVEPAVEPEVEEPAEVAPSVLAHVAAPDRTPASAAPDDDHTGTMPEDEVEEPRRRRTGENDEEEASGGTWRRVAAFIGGALLVGAAIGAGSAVIGNLRADDEPTDPATTESGAVPVTDDLPEDGGTVDIQVQDETLAPRQLTIDRDNGTSVELSWTPPEQAIDFYAVVLVDDPDDVTTTTVLTAFPPPAFETTVEGLDPDGNECFAVVGVVRDNEAAGMSEVRCR